MAERTENQPRTTTSGKPNTEQTASSVKPPSSDVDMDRLGESSDPEVHKLLAERQAHEMNRKAAGGEPDREAIAVIDAQIEAIDHRLRNLNKPETAKLREQRDAAAAKGDAAEVAAIDAKLDGK
jgi:hypothetical protein